MSGHALMERLAHESREDVEGWNKISALLHGACVDGGIELHCAGSRSERDAYGLVLRLRVSGIEVVMAFAQLPFAQKIAAFSKPWSLQEVSGALQLLVVEGALREALGERFGEDVVLQGVGFSFSDEEHATLKVRIPLEFHHNDALAGEVDVRLRSVEDVGIIAKAFGVRHAEGLFPPALSLRFPLRAGSAHVSAQEAGELEVGDIILLERCAPEPALS